MTYSRRRIATVLMAVLGSFTLFLTGSAQAQSLSLWNGGRQEYIPLRFGRPVRRI